MKIFLHLLVSLPLLGSALAAEIPPPQAVLGFDPGADHKLASYEQMLDYYRRLDQASNRIQVLEIGPTAEGRPMILAIMSSEANMARLEEYRRISERLARARLDEQQARRQIESARAVVWIDGGLHATEVAHAQHSPLLAYRVVSEETEEMSFIRDNVILLQVPIMNPDGLDIVVRWYRKNLGTPFETSPLPELYHKYVGHDNNRDWYMMTQQETRNVSRVLYGQWYPQIVYNHHQSPPFPARIFVPPFAPPMNPNIPPLVLRGIDLAGSAISAHLEAEGKSGVISRISYTTWWNGGMRTTPYFHNMVGILTETALYRYATPHFYRPEDFPKTFSNELPTLQPSADYPNPWKGGWWRMADAVDYMMSASLAVLDLAARHRRQWLENIYRMGREAIRRGENEAPFAYLIPQEQHDPSAAVSLIETLIRGGVEVHQSEAAFEAAEQAYPSGTYIVYTAQAFRPYVIDLMEPQKYPERRLYPEGPPIRPYDITGWTLPIQMGVDTVRVTEPFRTKAAIVEQAMLPKPAEIPHAEAYLIDRRWNLSYRLINALLSRKVPIGVSSSEIRTGTQTFPPGAFILQASRKEELEELAARYRVPVYPLENRPQSGVTGLGQPRIGVYKSWVAAMDEGWTRWLLDQFGFPYVNLSSREIQKGELKERLDVIVLPSQDLRDMMFGHSAGSMPPEYVGGLEIEGLNELKKFVEAGGILVTLDQASSLASEYLGVPVRNVLRDLRSSDFFCPGSLLRLEADPSHVLAYGMKKPSAAFFVESQAYELEQPAQAEPPAAGPLLQSAARYGDSDLLLSGWILGEEKIRGKPAVVQVKVGQGGVVMLGFRTHFRGQPHATFKLFFNAVYLGGMASQ